MKREKEQLRRKKLERRNVRKSDKKNLNEGY